MKVKIVKEVKRSDGLWRFACGDVFSMSACALCWMVCAVPTCCCRRSMSALLRPCLLTVNNDALHMNHTIITFAFEPFLGVSNMCLIEISDRCVKNRKLKDWLKRPPPYTFQFDSPEKPIKGSSQANCQYSLIRIGKTSLVEEEQNFKYFQHMIMWSCICLNLFVKSQFRGQSAKSTLYQYGDLEGSSQRRHKCDKHLRKTNMNLKRGLLCKTIKHCKRNAEVLLCNLCKENIHLLLALMGVSK